MTRITVTFTIEKLTEGALVSGNFGEGQSQVKFPFMSTEEAVEYASVNVADLLEDFTSEEEAETQP